MIKAAFLAGFVAAYAFLSMDLVKANSIETAKEAYAEGRFVEAAELAEALLTTDGFAFAAQSLAIYGYFLEQDDKKRSLFNRAAQLAEEAIRLDPQNPEAHLQHAHAMGRFSQTIGVLEALGEGYAITVRKSIEKALELDPLKAAAHLSLGTWHAEVIGNAGFMGSLLYGASGKKGLVHYEMALELEPGEKLVHYEYALGLLLLNKNKNLEKAKKALVRATELQSKDAFDEIIHQRAVEKLAVLDGK